MNPATTIPDEREGLTSASAFERVVQCPASVTAEREAVASGAFVEKPENAVRDAGTRIHDALLSGELSELVASEEQITTKIKEMEKAAFEQWFADLKLPEHERAGVQVIREKRFWVSGADGKITSAKVDVAYVVTDEADKHCILLDAKSGFLAVTSANANWQLRVGIVALDRALGPFKSARVAIAQYRTKERFSRCDYNRQALDHAYHEIIFHDSRSKQPDAPFAAGKWCQYCKAITTCATYATYNLLPSVRAQTIGLVKKADIVARVQTLTPVDLAFIHSRGTAMANLVEAVKDRLKAMTDEELKALGLERVPTGSNPDTFDIPAIWQTLAEQKLITADEFKAVCKIVLGDLKAIVVPKLALRNETSQAAAEKHFVGLVKPHITYKEKSPAIKQITN